MRHESAPVAEHRIPEHVPTALVVDFDLYNMENEAADFHLAWKSLQEERPDDHLLWTPRNEGHWIAMRGEVIQQTFADTKTFTNRVFIVPKSAGEKFTALPTTLDPPEHGPVRALINPHLSPRAIQRMEPGIRKFLISLIEKLESRGGCEFIDEFAEILPIAIFMNMVDLPFEDAHKLKFWANEINLPTGQMTMDEIMTAFADYLAPWIKARRAEPGDDLISAIVTSELKGAPIDDATATSLLTQVLLGGLDTVAFTLGFVMLFLARNPDYRQQLIDDPVLVPGAVDELLRRFPIATNFRMVREDCEFMGVHMKGGDMIAMPTVLHGLDEREYDDPLKIDFRRRIERTSTFGNGVHRCPGNFLARTEIRLVLEEWLKRIPEFHLAPDAKIEMKGGMVGSVRELQLRWTPRGAH